MTDLIAKLSKIDQRNVRMALIHAANGNYRALDSMVRAANSRSQATLVAIRALV
jgi:DNA transposition AAA+ family ATPase